MVLEQYGTSAVESYTVIYAGGPRTEKPQTYTAEFTDSGAGHSELKRQLHDVNGVRRQAKNDKNLPLFEKYQYFTPGRSIIPRLYVLTVSVVVEISSDADPNCLFRYLHGLDCPHHLDVYLVRWHFRLGQS